MAFPVEACTRPPLTPSALSHVPPSFIAQVEGTNAAHGEAGVPYQKTARANLGLPENELWHVAPETKSFFAARKVRIVCISRARARGCMCGWG